MAQSEIKAVITADNKQFLKAINEVLAAVKKLDSTKIADISKAISSVPDKDINISADSSQALDEVKKISKAFKEIKTQEIEVKIVGSVSGILGAIIEKIKGSTGGIEVPIIAKQSDQFDPLIKSAGKFIGVLGEVNTALKKIERSIIDINKRKLIVNQRRVGKKSQDTENTESEVEVNWLKTAIDSAEIFIKKLKLINKELAAAAKTASRIVIPSAGQKVSSPVVSPKSQPRAPSPAQSTSGVFDGFSGGLTKVAATAAALLYTFEEIKGAADKVFGTGLRYNQQMETSRLGIAGILMSMTTLNGKQLQLNDAMKISDDMLKQIQVNAAKIGLPADEMIAAFQTITGPGLAAKMTLQELVDFVPSATKAVKTILGAMGDERQVTQELRAMISGDITMDAQVSKALGITKTDVDKAKENAGGLFNYLMEKLSGFKALQEEWPKTMTGSLEKLKTSYSQASGNAFEKIFEKAKEKVNSLTDALFTVNEKTKLIEFKPEFLDSIQTAVDYTILLAEKLIYAGNMVIPHLGTPLQVIGNLLKFIIDNVYGVATAIATWATIQKAIVMMQAMKTEIIATRTEMIALQTTTVGAMGAAAAGAGGAAKAIGKIEIAVAMLKKAIRGLMLASVLGAVAAAAGYAVEKIMDYLDEIDDKKRKKEEANSGKFSSGDSKFGWLSKSHEGDYDTISSGENDPFGGKSYGSWQFSSKQGTADKFRKWLKDNGWDAGNLLQHAKAGTEAFDSLWHQAAKAFGVSFENAQRAFMTEEYYDPAHAKLKEKYGFDTEERSGAMREVVTSTAIQHGLGEMVDVMEIAAKLANVPNISWLKDDKLIDFIYQARTQVFPRDRERYEAENKQAKNNLAQNPQSASSQAKADDLEAKKREASEAEIKKSQKAMQIATQRLTANADLEKKAIDHNLERLEQDKENMSDAEYVKKKAQLQYDKLKMDLDTATAKKDLINQAIYRPDEPEEKEKALLGAENEIKAAAQALKYFAETVSDVDRIIGQIDGGEGKTWTKSAAENPKYDQLENKAKQAIDVVAGYVYNLTGEKMSLTSGKRSADLGYSSDEIGGHSTGLKFDAVAEAFKNPEIRKKVIEFARSIGIEVLDEYAKLSEKGSGLHLDFNAENFFLNAEGQAKARIANAQSQLGKEIYDNIMRLYQEADNIVSQLKTVKGDVSSSQKEKLALEYNELIKKFELAGLTEFADKVRELKDIEFNKLDFAQTQHDLDNASTELSDFQEALVKSVSDSSVEASAVMGAYVDRYHELTDKYRKELEEQLRTAVSLGNVDGANKIRAAIKALDKTLQTGLENIIKGYNDELQMQISEINANRKMTKLQKADAIDKAERRQYNNEAMAHRQIIGGLQLINENEEYDSLIANLEREAALKDKLSEIPSLLDRIHEAAAQAFEDGLLDFFERGIFECESLGEAFRNLAITVLESIQKIFAEDMTKNIMIGLGFGDKYTAPDGSGLSSKFGTITTETNGFLVSFDALMGDFVIKAQTNFSNILQTINSAVNAIPSVMPSLDFAGLGNTGAGGSSDNFYNSPSGTNWWENIPGFAEGGAISADGKITGPGTGTSDSILAWLSNGERVVDAATVKRYGDNFFERLKSGDIYNLRIPIPKYAKGGLVGSAGASAVTRGMESFGANLGTNLSANFNPSIHNVTEVRFDGKEFNNMFETKTKSVIRKNMMEIVMLANKTGRIR